MFPIFCPTDHRHLYPWRFFWARSALKYSCWNFLKTSWIATMRSSRVGFMSRLLHRSLAHLRSVTRSLNEKRIVVRNVNIRNVYFNSNFPLFNFNVSMLLPCQQGATRGSTVSLRAGHCCEEPHSTSQSSSSQEPQALEQHQHWSLPIAHSVTSSLILKGVLANLIALSIFSRSTPHQSWTTMLTSTSLALFSSCNLNSISLSTVLTTSIRV